MFETEDFKRKITAVISGEVSRRKLGYESGIVEYLQRLAVGNEEVLMKRQTIPPRGVDDAVQSAIILIEEACRYASIGKRATVTLADMEAAYKAKFCQVWPFCK